MIYSSGNGVPRSTTSGSRTRPTARSSASRCKLCPAEEIIWSKAYVQERERFDGADVAHLIRGRGEALDWDRLLRRFGDHWRVLFGHLVLFGFIYPAERDKIPGWVLRELSDRLVNEIEGPSPRGQVCFGTLLSREQYLPDIGKWGYHDARLKPWARCPRKRSRTGRRASEISDARKHSATRCWGFLQVMSQDH